MQRKLVLVVVDAMHPEMLVRAIDEDLAPTFGALLERGQMVPDCVSSFPSVTPVASSEMMTGTGPAGHWVMGMNWYHRVERRYIEYGSSFEATRTFGLFRAMYDLVYNMNLDHLSWQAQTVFERLGDAGIRTAATPFLIYRGRHRHELGLEGLAKRAAAAANFRHAVWGPDEFFYGDIYASRPTGCGPTFTRPGTRDEYSACVAEELVREGAYDFLLFSLPDNDFHSHRHGPEATLESIAKADAMFARIVEAGGGLDAFLVRARRACSPPTMPRPRSSTRCRSRTSWPRTGRCSSPTRTGPRTPRSRSARPRARAPSTSWTPGTGTPRHPRARPPPPPRARRRRPGHLAGTRTTASPVVRTGRRAATIPRRVDAVVERNGYEFRFRPGGQLRDVRGNAWAVSGEPEALAGDITRRPLRVARVPGRTGAALVGAHLAARGRHPDLRRRRLRVRRLGRDQPRRRGQPRLARQGRFARPRSCSWAAAPTRPDKRPQWALRDLAPVILEHFGVDGGRPQG